MCAGTAVLDQPVTHCLHKPNKHMKTAVFIAWRTPPTKYGPWEQVASNIAEGLVEKGIDVNLFATGNSKNKRQIGIRIGNRLFRN